MFAHFKSSRLLLSLAVGTLAAGCLLANNPRYPDLDDPFGPRTNQRPKQGPMRPPPPPVVDSPKAQQDAKEILGAVDSSSAYYDEEARVTMEQLYALERFLDTPPEQLARIRETIERVEAMTDEEKAELRQKIQAFRELHQDKIDRLRDAYAKWQSYKPEDRRLVHRYMMSLPKEQANEIRTEIAAMPPEEREAFFQTLLAKAKEAEQANTLPDLPDTVREWRDRRNEDNRANKNDRNRPGDGSDDAPDGPPPPPPQ